MMFWAVLVGFVTGQNFFSSNQAMRELVETEGYVLNQLNGLIDQQMMKLKELKEKVEEQKSKTISHDELDHPLNQFLLIRRFLEEIPPLIDDFNEIGEDLFELHPDEVPNKDDLKGAIDGLFRVQDTYQLKTDELAGGRLGHYAKNDTVPSLSSQLCFEIGFHAYSQKDFYHSSLWMQNAWNRRHDQSMGNGHQILDYLAYSISQEGHPEQARNLTLLLHEQYPEVRRYEENLHYYNKLPKVIHKPSSSHQVDYENLKTEDLVSRPLPSYEYKQVYERLCREKTEYPKDISSQLTCFYWHGKDKNTFITWAPVRSEMLYPEPLIIQFYDIISETESTVLQNLATSRLKQATIRDPETGLLRNADYRIQKTTWLEEDIENDDDEIVAKFNQRISDITGLSMETAELLQMGNYGVGGQYEPHWDHQAYPGSDNQWADETGSRIGLKNVFYS